MQTSLFRAKTPSLLLICALLFGCESESSFDPQSPARGPGSLVGLDGQVSSEALKQGVDQPPTPREVEPPSMGAAPNCDAQCVSYCEGLGLKNRVNQGLCQSSWGVGLPSTGINKQEACRRLFVDLLGFAPTKAELVSGCQNQPLDAVVSQMLRDDRFIVQQRKLWADTFRYDTEAISVERIYDMDQLVSKLYQGLVPYDKFVAIASAHPVFVRRYDTAGDRAEGLFNIFMGRPPLGSERSDIARLYNLWENGYYDHPQLGIRLPDAVVRYRCLNDKEEADEQSSGPCTSILYGYNPLILKPDLRAEGEPGNKTMWSGLLKAQEWAKLQMPGRLLAKDRVLWEHAVDTVLIQHLGYNLGELAPKVRQGLVDLLLENKGDIRAVHHAVLTSLAYLQTSKAPPAFAYRWTYGPLKQIPPEAWIDTIANTTGYDLGRCDHRINRPDRLLEADTVASWALVKSSWWNLDGKGEIDMSYRNLARSLGGCPSNDAGGRFKIISILTTATQLNYVNQVCDTANSGDGTPVQRLLPAGMSPDRAVNAGIAEEIVTFQTELFYGRSPSPVEREEARAYGEQCEREVCKAQDFARPACFAILSSAEMLFY